jgi:predicted NodU family carbamoyl transferase
VVATEKLKDVKYDVNFTKNLTEYYGYDILAMQRKIKGMASAEANYKPRWLPELRSQQKNGVRKRDRRHRTQKILEIETK